MPGLRAIELTGGRRRIRVGICYAIFVASAIEAVSYVLPAHRLTAELSFHSNLDDGGPLPLLALAVVATLTPWLARRRFGAGWIVGVLGAAGALASCAPVVLAHMLSHVTYASGELLFWGSCLGLFGLGCVMLGVEPVVYLLERRRIMQAAQPAPLPVAKLRS